MKAGRMFVAGKVYGIEFGPVSGSRSLDRFRGSFHVTSVETTPKGDVELFGEIIENGERYRMKIAKGAAR